MPAENSTKTPQMDNNTVKTVPGLFLDPWWQLALTVEFYFKYAVLAIGVVGTAANALVLYALIAHNARDAKKRAINLLIINQNLLDRLNWSTSQLVTRSCRHTRVSSHSQLVTSEHITKSRVVIFPICTPVG